MGKIESFRRGEIYGSVRTVFFEKQKAVDLSHKTFQTTEINFIPLYMGRRMAEIKNGKTTQQTGPDAGNCNDPKAHNGQNGNNKNNSSGEQALEGQINPPVHPGGTKCPNRGTRVATMKR